MRGLCKRAALALAIWASIAAPAMAQTTLRMVSHADIKILDPVWTTALITRNFGYMVYDTLFATDADLKVQPQMAEKYTVSDDKMTWTITLRDGLVWSDGTPVTSDDCIASLKRWGVRDSYGQALMSSTGELKKIDDKTFAIVLKEPFGLVLESLAYAVLQGSTDHARWLAGHVETPGNPLAGRLLMEREGATLQLTLDRVPGNTIDRALRDQLHQAFALAALDETITRIVLQAGRRSFCLGADLTEFGTTRDPATAHAIRRQTLPAPQIARCADRLEVRVQGGCVGAGLEMAAWARQLVATPGAWFQLPELAMGILPGAGGCVALTRRIGRQRTALMVLSGKRISARTALGWGLIDTIVNDIAADDGGADIIG